MQYSKSLFFKKITQQRHKTSLCVKMSIFIIINIRDVFWWHCRYCHLLSEYVHNIISLSFQTVKMAYYNTLLSFHFSHFCVNSSPPTAINFFFFLTLLTCYFIWAFLHTLPCVLLWWWDVVSFHSRVVVVLWSYITYAWMQFPNFEYIYFLFGIKYIRESCTAVSLVTQLYIFPVKCNE